MTKDASPAKKLKKAAEPAKGKASKAPEKKAEKPAAKGAEKPAKKAVAAEKPATAAPKKAVAAKKPEGAEKKAKKAEKAPEAPPKKATKKVAEAPAKKAPEAAPSAKKLPAAAPSAKKIPAAAPSAKKLPAAAPSTKKLPAERPSMKKLPTERPSSRRLDSAPQLPTRKMPPAPTLGGGGRMPPSPAMGGRTSASLPPPPPPMATKSPSLPPPMPKPQQQHPMKRMMNISDPPPAVKMTLAIGDNAVHLKHGVGEVVALESMPGLGDFYRFVLLDDRTKKFMVPTNGQTVLRPIMSASEADTVIDTMRAKEVAVNEHPWSRRFRVYQEMINSGSPFEVAKVMRDMHRLKFDKDLSFGERVLLDRAKSLLMKELALAKGITEEALQAEVTTIFST